MAFLTIAILRGGPGTEHEISLQTGTRVRDYLLITEHERNRRVIDVFIDRTGQWYVRGVPVEPARALNQVDVVWNGLHGEYGEDGTLQALLSRIGVPYTGSNEYASKLGMNKLLSKKQAQSLGIQTPYAHVLNVSSDLSSDIVNAFRSFPQPSVIKPLNRGSSVGVRLTSSFDEFKEGIRDAFQHSNRVLIEEYIPGKEATVGAIEGLRNSDVYVLPPTEIKMGEAGIFDYEQKYKDVVEELCPGNFTTQERSELTDITQQLHRALGLRHYSRSDFRVSPNGIYYLETNTLPGLTQASLFPKGLNAVGVTFDEFVEHILHLALT